MTSAEPTGGGSAPDLPRPLGVVVDTNLWRSGSLDLDRLRKHAAKLKLRGIRLLVPRQVVLEWAHHAHRDATTMAPTWNRLAAAGHVEGKSPAGRDVKSIRDAMITRLESINNVTILPMTGGAAVQGIEDQILGEGAAATKSGVKTGAVDSSMIRDSIDFVGGDTSKVVFVTKNQGDFRNAGQSMGVPLRICKEEDLYRLQLAQPEGSAAQKQEADEDVEPIPTEDELSLMIRAAMEAQRQAAIEDYDGHSPSLDSWLSIDGPELGEINFEAPHGFEVTDVEVRPEPRLLDISDVDVIDSDAPLDDDYEKYTGDYKVTVEFTATLRGDLTIHGYFFDSNGAVQNDAVEAYDVLITAPLSADIDTGQVDSIYPAGQAFASEG